MICVLGSDFPNLGSQMPRVGESRASITFIFTESQEAKFVLVTHILPTRTQTSPHTSPARKQNKNAIVLKRYSCLAETKAVKLIRNFIANS